MLAEIVLVREVEDSVHRLIGKTCFVDFGEGEADGIESTDGADAFEDEVAFVVAFCELEGGLQVGEFVVVGHVDTVAVVRKRNNAYEGAERLDAKLLGELLIFGGVEEFFPNDGVRPIAHGANRESDHLGLT